MKIWTRRDHYYLFHWRLPFYYIILSKHLRPCVGVKKKKKPSTFLKYGKIYQMLFLKVSVHAVYPFFHMHILGNRTTLNQTFLFTLTLQNIHAFNVLFLNLVLICLVF